MQSHSWMVHVVAIRGSNYYTIQMYVYGAMKSCKDGYCTEEQYIKM